MVDADLIARLCCPETHQEIRLAEADLVERLNRGIAEKTLKSRAGLIVNRPLDGGLVRADGKFLYPIWGDIPVMLVEEAIPL